MKTATRVHVRWFIRRDMPEVLNIEAGSFEYAWNEEDFLRCLRQQGSTGMVAEIGERVVGFFIYVALEKKIQVFNFAVHPGYRRQHVGAQMTDKLKSKLSSHRRTRITADVREGNLPAQLFFRAQEFKAVDILRGFYQDSGESAYHLAYQMPGTEEEAAPVNRIAQYEDC